MMPFTMAKRSRGRATACRSESAARARAAAVFFVVATLAGGCGPKKPSAYPVEGIVTLDGVPLPGASVVFRPTAGGQAAAGLTDQAGRYVLSTLGYKPGAGALATAYAVTVRKYKSVEDELPPKPAEPEALAKWQSQADALLARWTAEEPPLLTPKPYAIEATSGLSATVGPGRNQVDFALDKNFKGVPVGR